jgi:circadian clock protein KaiB
MADKPSHKDEFERLLIERSNEKYVLKLFVTGMTPRSTEAVATIQSICKELLEGRYELEVVDLYENPGTAGKQQIVAAPTLVKEAPLPVRRLVGDLANRPRVLGALNLPSHERRGQSEP